MKALFYFLISKQLWKNLLIMILVFVFLVIAVDQVLKMYTRHGQKIPLPDYVGESITSASEDAERRTFEIIIADSVYMVGRRGGIILDQIPEAGQLVKEDRKIYVTTTKFKPDMVRLEDLPPFYGRNYERTARVLNMAHSIRTSIVERTFDPGPEGHIMGVLFEGDTIVYRDEMKEGVQIPIGGSLGFIVSQQRGGTVEVPNLVCRTYDEAEFIIASYKLRVGNTRMQGEVSSLDRAFVVGQDPEYASDARIEMGSPINLILSEQKPEDCDNFEE